MEWKKSEGNLHTMIDYKTYVFSLTTSQLLSGQARFRSTVGRVNCNLCLCIATADATSVCSNGPSIISVGHINKPGLKNVHPSDLWLTVLEIH